MTFRSSPGAREVIAVRMFTINAAQFCSPASSVATAAASPISGIRAAHEIAALMFTTTTTEERVPNHAAPCRQIGDHSWIS
jgi:hypothetical protein